jgi:hypothetical protein
MPTRTQTPTRPATGRFGRPARKPTGRPAGKPSQRSARGRHTTPSRRPTMPTMGRKPAKKSGAAKAADKLTGLLPGTGNHKRGTRGQKRGGSSGPGKKGAAGLALLAGATGLLVKNREKLTSMIRHRDSSGDAVRPVEPQAGPVASNSGPVDPAAASPPVFPDQPAG